MPFMTDIDEAKKHMGPRYIKVELPIPPSVNRFVARFGNSNNDVVRWRKRAHNFMMSKGRHPGTVEGKVDVTIVWDNEYDELSDIDNRIKPLLDYIQDVKLIGNDRRVKELHVMFGNAPEGCIVEIEKHQEPRHAGPNKEDNISKRDAGAYGDSQTHDAVDAIQKVHHERKL